MAASGIVSKQNAGKSKKRVSSGRKVKISKSMKSIDTATRHHVLYHMLDHLEKDNSNVKENQDAEEEYVVDNEQVEIVPKKAKKNKRSGSAL